MSDAVAGNGLCGHSRVGQITISAWHWGDQGHDGSGGATFTVALMFRVRGGHVGPSTSWTDYPVPQGWHAYQLPMYLSGHGTYVAGAPFR